MHSTEATSLATARANVHTVSTASLRYAGATMPCQLSNPNDLTAPQALYYSADMAKRDFGLFIRTASMAIASDSPQGQAPPQGPSAAAWP